MSIHKIKDEINGIKKWEGKNKREDLKYRTNITHMVFSYMKRKDILLKVFILAKLIWMMLEWIKAIY